LEKYVTTANNAINRRLWVDSLKTTVDPVSGDPIVTKVSIKKTPTGSYTVVPKGYHLETFAGQNIAVKNGYDNMLSALTDPSILSKSTTGQIVQKATATGKALTLAVDTFHLGRVGFWNGLIKSLGIRTFQLPIPSYKKGVTLLDHSIPELQTMITHGEIPLSWAKGLMENKRVLNLGVKTGYNVGGILDSLHQDWVHNVWGIGDFNTWIFDQYQRGAMAESYLLEFQRYRNAYPSLPEIEVARMVSRDLNIRYGNLGRQGLLKSNTAKDMARLLFLAPQWNEGLIRSEVGAVTQLGKAAIDAATGKRLFAGVLARSVGGMIAMQFLSSQLINYATRGTPTWENPEEGFGAKLSAWIPDFWGGPGFFLNPMALAMETTHLLMKGYERKGDMADTALSYLRGRSSTVARPLWDFVTGKDVMGTSYAPGKVWMGMLKDSVPIPILGGAIYAAAKEAVTGEPSQQFAGQYQKQMLSSVGIKVDQAPSDESRLYTLVNHFKLENNIPDKSGAYGYPYKDINHALMIGNMTDARKAMTQLLETKSPKEIEKYFKNTYPSMKLLQSNNQMKEFLNTLNDEQLTAYDRAKDKRKDTANAALDLLKEMK
jgi:hypothetical protein